LAFIELKVESFDFNLNLIFERNNFFSVLYFPSVPLNNLFFFHSTAKTGIFVVMNKSILNTHPCSEDLAIVLELTKSFE